MTTKPLPDRLKLTYADYLLFPGDLCRHEILDGEHVRTRAPGLLHQEVLMDLLGHLWGWVKESGHGEVMLGPLCVVLSEHNVVEPDLMYIARENRDRITDDNIQGSPDLVIEILCEETRKIDEVRKRRIYEAHGVQEYWIPDPELETVKVYRRQGTGFGPATALAAERAEALTTPLLPGFELPLKKLFEGASSWQRQRGRGRDDKTLEGSEMTPLTKRIKLTHTEYRVFPNDGRRHEILDGEHAASGAPGIQHQRVSKRLLRALDAAAEEHGAGEVFHGPVAVVLSEFDVVEPDLLFVATERAAIIRRDEINGAPDLVVEVLSPSSRRLDEIVKRKAYEDFGVEEYWIADPELETVKVFRRQGAGFSVPMELAAERGEALTTPLLPGFELPLQTVFSS